jgi:hypothetical protein
MRPKHFLLGLLVILAASLAYPAAAQETIVDCPPHPTAMDSFATSSTVVIAKITSVKLAAKVNGVQPARSVTMEVLKAYKGSLKRGDKIKFAGVVTIRLGWMFTGESEGLELLLYLSPDEQREALWRLPVCSRSNSVEQMAADLRFLDRIDDFRGRTRLSGTVNLWQSEAETAVGVTVRINGPAGVFELQTDAQGVYELYDLPAGSYQVEAVAPAGWGPIPSFNAHTPNLDKTKWKPGSSTIPIIVEAGKQANVDLFFQPDNALRGRMIDALGRPISWVGVHAVAVGADPEDEDALDRGSDGTKPDGSFSIESLPTGRYQLLINQGGSITGATPFAPFYYPNTSERARAKVFTIKAGQVIDGIVIRPRETAETVVISGRMLFVNDQPVAVQTVGFMPEGGGWESPSATDLEGRFSIRVFKGARGTLTGVFEPRSKDLRNCPALAAWFRTSWFRMPATQSLSVPVRTDIDTSELVLKYPFAPCADEHANPTP